MIVAIAAGQQPRFTADPTVPISTITAYIVQVAEGDVPHNSLEYKTIFLRPNILVYINIFIKQYFILYKKKFQEQYD